MNELMSVLAEKQRYCFNGKEKDFEGYIINNLSEIFNHVKIPAIKSIARQKAIQLQEVHPRNDIVVEHIDNTVSIIEVKSVNSRYPLQGRIEQAKAIGQLLYYESCFEVKHKVKPRLFLFDTKIYRNTYLVVLEHKLPISLVEIQNDRVLFLGRNLE